ncbi:hypothetical protein Tco_1533117 [Tanacetum coccineum]
MFEIPERTSFFSRLRCDRSESPRHRQIGKERKDRGVFNRLEARKRMCPHIQKAVTRAPGQEKRNHSPRVKTVEDDTGNQDLRRKSQGLRKTTCLNHGDDPEDHLKIFHAAAKVECWAIPTWCHMFNSTHTGSTRVWFDDLPSESIDSYDDLKRAFLANFLQQKKLRPEVKNQMVPASATLIGFSGEVIWPIGQILLPVKIGDAEHSTSTWMNFVVVRSPSPYNGIIGIPREAQTSNVVQAMDERIKVAINPEYPEQTIVIGSTLTEEGRKALCNLLRRNLDIFS